MGMGEWGNGIIIHIHHGSFPHSLCLAPVSNVSIIMIKWFIHHYDYVSSYGGFNSHGDTPKWMVYKEQSHLESMMTGGAHMIQETTIWILMGTI